MGILKEVLLYEDIGTRLHNYFQSKIDILEKEGKIPIIVGGATAQEIGCTKNKQNIYVSIGDDEDLIFMSEEEWENIK